MSAWTLKARWVFPVSGPPLADGLVTIDGDRITAVGPAGASAADVDLGDAAVLPGFVNAHTHLDLTGMRGLAPPSPDFTGWLRQVIAHRRSRTPEQVADDIRTGLGECVRSGTTLVGDISGDGSSWDALATAPLRAVVFHELLGLSLSRAREAAGTALKWLRGHNSSSTCRPGLSPHAPYSYRAEILPALALHGERITIHLAETVAELELLERQSGPFVPFLAERGVWDPGGLAWGPGHVVELTGPAKAVLYAHGNYLSPDIAFPPHGTVVYCPRTHAAFGHSPHPFRDFLARSVRVALGTDSLASNPDLDILAEVRFLHGLYPGLPGETLLRMLTLAGAEALGWADETGSLDAGKSADLVVIRFGTPGGDPYHRVLGGSESVSAVLFRGRWTYDDLIGTNV